nr:replication associated protein [Dragonfly larvae associated circular virus-3]
MANRRSRGWCFTLNNYTPEHEALLAAVPCAYMIFGREVGANGTPHLQGFVYFPNAKTFNGAKAVLPAGCHLEAAMGSVAQNVEYCSKDGDVEERGERPLSAAEKGASEAQRWKDARLAAVSGDIADVPDDIYIRYYRTLKEISKDHMARPDGLDGVCGLWLYGAAGTGKSRYAQEQFPEDYMKMTNKWWDGYQGQDVVVMDDMDPDHACLRHHLKRWADRYPFIGETKGGAISIRPKKFVVTSQYSIEDMFKNRDGTLDVETVAAIRRRFEVKRFGVNAFNPYNI